MARSHFSIGQVMRLTALAALDLVIVPNETRFLLGIPVILWLLVALNFVLVRAFLLGRPLRAFDYTFVAVGAIASVGITWIVTHPVFQQALMSVLDRYRTNAAARWALRTYIDDEPYLGVMFGALAILPAWIAGRFAAARVSHRGPETGGPSRRRAELIAQGALIGTGLYFIATVCLETAGMGPSTWQPEQAGYFYAGMAASAMLGGLTAALTTLSPQRGRQNPRFNTAAAADSVNRS